MGKFVKPNVSLPVSLHDAQVTKISIVQGENFNEGQLVLHLKEGFHALEQEEWILTGAGEIRFGGIDWDFSSVGYFEEGKVREVSFEEFQKDLLESAFEIVHESFGYNYSVFSGYRYREKFFEVEMKIYHFRETEYIWEDKVPRE